MRVVIAALAVFALSTSAHAQPAPSPPRAFDTELRARVDDELRVAIRHINGVRNESLGRRDAAPQTLAATLSREGCAATPDAYWEAAARWMVPNVTPRLLPTAELYAPPYLVAIRTRINDMEQEIDRDTPRRFLEAGERAAATPRDFSYALRQRAEWTTALTRHVIASRADQEQHPTALRSALSLSVWMRTLCAVRIANGAVARDALTSSGYPATATHGANTEMAFAVLVAASGDSVLASEALARGGAGVAPEARRVLEPLAARAPATSQ